MELWISPILINNKFYTWNYKISKKLPIKWNFALIVFEQTVPDLYHSPPFKSLQSIHFNFLQFNTSSIGLFDIQGTWGL